MGLGQGLQNLGQTWGQNILARQERMRQDQQRQFENSIAKAQLDLQVHQQAQAEADKRKKLAFEMLSALPGDQVGLSAQQGQRFLQDLPEAEGLFIKQDPRLASRPFNMTPGGGVKPGELSQPTEYTATRPISDSYARALMKRETDQETLAVRRQSMENRLAMGNAANNIRMQIAQMTDQRQKAIAQAALGALMRRHADNLSLRTDANNLDWLQADADLEMEWQKMQANSLFPVDPRMQPVAPSSKRSKPPAKGLAPEAPAADPDSWIDEIINEIGAGK